MLEPRVEIGWRMTRSLLEEPRKQSHVGSGHALLDELAGQRLIDGRVLEVVPQELQNRASQLVQQDIASATTPEPRISSSVLRDVLEDAQTESENTTGPMPQPIARFSNLRPQVLQATSQQIFLAGAMRVERGSSDIRFGGDVIYRDVVEALAPQQPDQCFAQSAPGFLHATIFRHRCSPALGFSWTHRHFRPLPDCAR